MNEIKIGDVTVTRVEEMHGPIMPTEAFLPSMPAEAWQRHIAEWAPKPWGP